MSILSKSLKNNTNFMQFGNDSYKYLKCKVYGIREEAEKAKERKQNDE